MLHSPEAAGLPAALRHTLTGLVPESSLTEVNLGDGSLPLVLMESGHAVHAFAVGEEQEYIALYEAFKKHFLSGEPGWTAKDVSFVFCIPDGEEVSETFPSKVEVDVYFCRKYVIQFGPSLETSLARLPFLPLAPISGGLIRPPSAKTLLRQRNMTTDLANSLVEPGTAAGTILENCLGGKYGPAHGIDKQSPESSSKVKAEQREQTTLKSISIENFRAYRKKKEFNFGSSITVLYGPNGFGKTSFFDAVDFVVTGGVGRLDKPSSGLSKIAKHLDSKDDPTQVSLTFERAGKEHVISRNLNAPNDATLDGKVAPRKAILSALTGGETGPSDRVENLVSLFRATHLFSQDRQELTGEVADRCELPADIVSRMLAFDDYVNGLKKVNEVLRLAKLDHLRSLEQSRKTRDNIRIDETEVARLESILTVATVQEVLDARFDELNESLVVTGFELNGVSVRDTRALRALLDAASAESATRRTTLERCLEHVANLRLWNGQLSPLQTQADETKAVAEQADAAVREAARRVAIAAGEAAQKKSEEDEAKNLRDWVYWAVSVQPDSARLTSEIQTQSNRLSTLSESTGHQREALSQAEVAYGEAQAALRLAEEMFAAESGKRTRLQQAEAKLEVAKTLSTRIVALQTSGEKAERELDLLRKQLTEPNQIIAAQNLLVARIEIQLAAAKNDADKLKGLVAELRSHVHGSECMLCGHDHGSPQQLINAIDSRAEQADLVVNLSQSLVTEREKQRDLEQQQNARSGAIGQAEQGATATRQELESVNRQLAECHAAFASIGLSLDEALASNRLADAIAKSLVDERNARVSATEAGNVLSASQNSLSKARQSYAVSESERKAVTTLIDDAKRRLNELFVEAQRGAINLSTGSEALQDSLREHEARLSQTSKLSQDASAAAEGARAAQSACEGRANAAKAAHQTALRSLNDLKATVQSGIAELAAAGLSGESTEAQVNQNLKAAQARELTAQALRERAAELEVATDTAATSAAFQSIRARIDTHENIAKQAEGRAALVAPWIKYFEGVSKLLSGQQAMATEHFTAGYGPRTEMIQQRLRPVYGFDGVAVTSKGSSIQIHIRRNGEDLRPTDFFSQSQVQTLVLGLFLTACSSQTWSGFSSIMMDDPVTHFDNLNTYALLDLILGLQSSSEGARQFVISTCDEKLLQLARHKFRHLGSAAKFYRFSAIGAEGPLVSELPT
jgi:exonuclease SbcC